MEVHRKQKVIPVQLQDKASEDKRPRIVAFTLQAGKQHRKDVYNHPPSGLISRVQITIDQDSQYNFQVLLFNKEKGSISTVDEYWPD